MGSSKDPATNTPANAIGICAQDHAKVESARAEALDNGWLVRQGKNPADIPLLYRGRWALLDEVGGVNYI